MKITIEHEDKAPEVIETNQFFILTDRGCSYSGAFQWLIGTLSFKLEEIKKNFFKQEDKIA